MLQQDISNYLQLDVVPWPAFEEIGSYKAAEAYPLLRGGDADDLAAALRAGMAAELAEADATTKESLQAQVLQLCHRLHCQMQSH